MQIGRLIAVIESDTSGLRAGLSEATAMVTNYETTIARAAGAGPEFAATTAIARTNAAAGVGAGTLGRWSGALSTAASAATVASGAVNVFGAAIRGVRAVQAAGGLARFAGSLTMANGGVRSLLPPTRTLVKVLAAGGAAYGLYRGITAITGAANTAKRAVGGLAREAATLGKTRAAIGSLATGAFGPLGVAVGGAAGGLAGIAGIGATAAWGVKLSAQAETARVAFTTLTGSAETARTLIADLQTFSAGTPFTLPGIQESARQLLAYGRTAEQLPADLAVLGDIAAGTGKPLEQLADIYGRVRTEGRATGETLQRLFAAGVPINEALAESMGIAKGEVKGLVSEGKVGFAEFARALELTTQAGGMFAGSMTAQSQTVAGMWSTLTDNFREGFRKAFEGATAYFNLPDLLREATQLVSAGSAVVAEYAEKWKLAAGEGVNWEGTVLGAVKSVARGLGTAANTAVFLGTGFIRMGATAVDALAWVIDGVESAARATVDWANMIPGVEVAYTGALGGIADQLRMTAGVARIAAAGIENMKPRATTSRTRCSIWKSNSAW